MHSYTIDSIEPKDRKALTIFILAIAAIALSLAINYLIPNYLIDQIGSTNTVISDKIWLISLPPLAIFWALYFAVDRLLWEISLFRWLLFVNTPVLRGKWNVQLRSHHHQYDDYGEKCSMTIEQRWTKIIIMLETDISYSHSLSASINIESPNEVRL